MLKSVKYFWFKITSKATTLIESFRFERLLLLSVNKVQSSGYEVKGGVPKGTVFDPLLFNIHFKDIMDTIDWNSFLKQFGDDYLVLSAKKSSGMANFIKIETFPKPVCFSSHSSWFLNATKSDCKFWISIDESDNLSKQFTWITKKQNLN